MKAASRQFLVVPINMTSLWKNEIAFFTVIGGFRALSMMQELSSLADLVVSKGLTQDGDEGCHL